MENLTRLIKNCASGKAKAQRLLYEMFAPKMFVVCMRYSKDQTEAEDNLQEGFIKVFDKIGTFKHEGSFEGWMRRIMVNVSLEKFRKQHFVHPVEDLSQYDSGEEEEEELEAPSPKKLMALIQELPPRYRMVFNLYVMESMNHRQIAQELKISEGTSKSNLARARAILKERIKHELKEAENTNTA